MATINDPEQLISKAKTISGQYEEAKERYATLSDERIAVINELREAQVSWAQIGRIFGISPQAAMYVTGHSKRSAAPKKGAAKKKTPKKG